MTLARSVSVGVHTKNRERASCDFDCTAQEASWA